jgi:hypothetical protein
MEWQPEINVRILSPDMFTVSTVADTEEESSPVDKTLRLLPLLEATAFPAPSIVEPIRLPI